MRSIEESLKSEQCRRILEALESGPKTTDELVKICRLTAGSVRLHANVLVVATLISEKPSETFSLTN
jgi:predicted transcriptional regulator